MQKLAEKGFEQRHNLKSGAYAKVRWIENSSFWTIVGTDLLAHPGLFGQFRKVNSRKLGGRGVSAHSWSGMVLESPPNHRCHPTKTFAKISNRLSFYRAVSKLHLSRCSPNLLVSF
jgi:hypothetical protein